MKKPGSLPGLFIFNDHEQFFKKAALNIPG
jgi:hypothetical protein